MQNAIVSAKKKRKDNSIWIPIKDLELDEDNKHSILTTVAIGKCYQDLAKNPTEKTLRYAFTTARVKPLFVRRGGQYDRQFCLGTDYAVHVLKIQQNEEEEEEARDFYDQGDEEH